MGLVEIIAFLLFLFGGFAWTLWRNFKLAKGDEAQESALADLMVANMGQPVSALRNTLGEPYEIETLAPGRELYVWKFPPAKTIPPGRGLVTLTASTNEGAVVDIRWRRRNAS
jgi:hypothetical protein